MIPWSHWNLDIPCKKASEYVLKHKLFRKQVYSLAITVFLQLTKAIAMKGVSIIQNRQEKSPEALQSEDGTGYSK